MKLWVDDMRDPRGKFDAHALDYNQAIALISQGEVEEISLDHDLGGEKTGYDIAKFIEKGAWEGKIKRMKWNVHSANPVGAKNITNAMRSAESGWDIKEEEGFENETSN